jgi:hypothetical protein
MTPVIRARGVARGSGMRVRRVAVSLSITAKIAKRGAQLQHPGSSHPGPVLEVCGFWSRISCCTWRTVTARIRLGAGPARKRVVSARVSARPPGAGAIWHRACGTPPSDGQIRRVGCVTLAGLRIEARGPDAIGTALSARIAMKTEQCGCFRALAEGCASAAQRGASPWSAPVERPGGRSRSNPARSRKRER